MNEQNRICWVTAVIIHCLILVGADEGGLIYEGGASDFENRTVSLSVSRGARMAIEWDIKFYLGKVCWLDFLFMSKNSRRRYGILGHYKAYIDCPDDVVYKITTFPGDCQVEWFNIKIFRLPLPEQLGLPHTSTKQDLYTRLEPKWVALDENPNADFVWLWPVKSAYGISTLALASGPTVAGSHEYVQLTNYEGSYNVLQVPGVSVAGPSYGSNADGNYYQGRQLLKYSRRDAAWLFWNFETGKPIWNGDHEGEYWSGRCGAVSGKQPGIVFNIRED